MAVYTQAHAPVTTLVAEERAKPKDVRTLHDRAGDPAGQRGAQGARIWHQSEEEHDQHVRCACHSW